MTNQELQEQFKRCEEWKDADQWDFLAMAYYSRGYWMNALFCFRKADARRADSKAIVPLIVPIEAYAVADHA
jgi:hypothetical protein